MQDSVCRLTTALWHPHIGLCHFILLKLYIEYPITLGCIWCPVWTPQIRFWSSSNLPKYLARWSSSHIKWNSLYSGRNLTSHNNRNKNTPIHKFIRRNQENKSQMLSKKCFLHSQFVNPLGVHVCLYQIPPMLKGVQPSSVKQILNVISLQSGAACGLLRHNMYVHAPSYRGSAVGPFSQC